MLVGVAYVMGAIGETSDEGQIGTRGILIRSLETAVMSVELRSDCLRCVCGEGFTTAH